MTIIDTPLTHEIILAYTNDRVQFTKTCILCNGETTIVVDVQRFDDWKSGKHVQNVWPEMNIDDRETLISGSHGSCFDTVFKDDD